VSEELCNRFSKRDNQIDAALKKLLETKPELAGTNLKDLREQLATKERTRKQKDLGQDELRTLWETGFLAPGQTLNWHVNLDAVWNPFVNAAEN